MTGLVNVITAILSFTITSMIGIKLIPFLSRLNFGQTIKEIGPIWHRNKQGTPTMGGLMFIVGITISTVIGFAILSLTTDLCSFNETVKLFAGLIFALAFGAIGYIDDYIKVVKKQNLGLRAMQKIVFQVLIAVFYIATMLMIGDNSTIVIFPFLGQVDLGLFYYPLVIAGIIFFVNAVNLTDGVDGLAGSVTFVASIGFVIICGLMRYFALGTFAVAIAAGCLGFLIWNFYPAKVFMGDTGSMFLGGCVVALGLGVGFPLILLLVGLIYLIEAMSVVLQVISFKTTGKRIFKMSPIHHHFEMSNWSEIKIVVVFSIITFVSSGVAVVAVLNI